MLYMLASNDDLELLVLLLPSKCLQVCVTTPDLYGARIKTRALYTLGKQTLSQLSYIPSPNYELFLKN